jgi:hypothetical protein
MTWPLRLRYHRMILRIGFSIFGHDESERQMGQG